MFIAGLLMGIALTLLGAFITLAMFVLHRPRYAAPTKYRRRYRDLPIPDAKGESLREATDWDVAERPLYMYGVTGEER